MVAIKIKVIAIYSDSRIENVCQYLVHVEPRPILQQFRYLMSGVKSVHVSDVACTVMVCNSNVFIYIFLNLKLVIWAVLSWITNFCIRDILKITNYIYYNLPNTHSSKMLCNFNPIMISIHKYLKFPITELKQSLDSVRLNTIPSALFICIREFTSLHTWSFIIFAVLEF